MSSCPRTQEQRQMGLQPLNSPGAGWRDPITSGLTFSAALCRHQGSHVLCPLAHPLLWRVDGVLHWGCLSILGRCCSEMAPWRGEQVSPQPVQHRAPRYRFTPDCNQYNLLKLIYFLLSFAHRYSCCNFSISMTFGGKISAFFTL